MDHENWKYCKIVEQNESGEIILHQNNLQTLIGIWSEITNIEDPINLVSFIGPQSCGKSFFSNLLIEYIKMQRSLSWTKRIKRKGLQGFSYGGEPNAVTDGQLIPEKNINALYFYPELLKLNIDQREEFICILHVHHGDPKSRNERVDIALDTVIAMMSSILVNIIWNDKNMLSNINELVNSSSNSSVKDHLTGNVINILRGDGIQENENVIHLEESTSLHDDKGLVKLSYQQYSGVNKLMKAISNFTSVGPAQATLYNILERFEDSIKFLNEGKGFNIPSLSTTTILIEETQPEDEAKLVDGYYRKSCEMEESSFMPCLPEETLNEDPLTKSIENEISPLFYQIEVRKICISTVAQNPRESSTSTLYTHSHSGEIGILTNDTWVCGDDVKKFHERGEVQKFWSFEGIFNMHDFSDTIVINRESINITLPYLLSIFFRMMKQATENGNNGKFGVAMISVPFWFSSEKRRQIREAGKIAGFDNVQLINLTMASAYLAYTSGFIPLNEQLVVISENSNRLDISIFSYNKTAKIIRLSGQSPDYDKTALSKATYLFQNPEAVPLNHSQKNEIFEKVKENLYKMWDLAKSCIQGRFNLCNKSVLVLCGSNHWRELLCKFSVNITTPGNISFRNNSTLLDFFHFIKTKKNYSVESLIENAVPFKIIITQGSQELVVLETKYAFLNPETQEFSFELPKSVGYFNFSENDLSSGQIIGRLHLKYTIPPTFKITITLKRVENGTFILSSVEYVEIPLYYYGEPKRKPLPVFYYEWRPTNFRVDQ